MPFRHYAVCSLGVLFSVSSVSLPIWATPQSPDSSSSASSLGRSITVSQTALVKEPNSSANLIEKVNAQLDTEIARRFSSQREPLFRWQPELPESQHRSNLDYQPNF